MHLNEERYRAAIKPNGRVDYEARTITGVSVCEKGPVRFDSRKQYVDDETLQRVLKLGRAAADGVKCHLTHEEGHGDQILSYLGRLRNFRIAGDAVVADLYVARSAKDGDFILNRASEDPKSFGASMVVSLDRDAPRRGDGFQAIRPLALFAVDMVGTPALTSGLLAEAFSAGGGAKPASSVVHLDAIASYLEDHHGYAVDGRTLLDHVEFWVDNTPGAVKPTAEAWAAIQRQSDELREKFEAGLVVDKFAINVPSRFGL